MVIADRAMAVSYVIPVFNRSRYIKEVIEAINRQSGINRSEVIIIDDASSDNPEKEINPFKQDNIKVFFNRQNMGAAYSRNLGFRMSKHEYIAFIDSDVILLPDTTVKMLEICQEYDIAHVVPFWPNGKPIVSLENSKEYPRISACYMMKKETLQYLDRIGQLYDENYGIYLEDIDFFFRCSLFGLKAKCIEEMNALHIAFDFTKDTSYRHYLCLRNNIYSNIKYLRIKIPGKPDFKNVFSFKSIILKIIAMLFNYDLYKKYSAQISGKKRHLNNIQWMRDPSLKITSRHLLLFFLIPRAILWNILNIHSPLKKGKQLAKLICQK
ncbi:MAG: glycosyltransferase family A protein [Candidatus Omnitrophota bacterium]|jgi:glycosyltransferase involved in cell wall biosynthesis